MCIRKTLYVCIVCGATFAKIQLFAMRVATFAMTGMFAVTASYQFGDIRPAAICRGIDWCANAAECHVLQCNDMERNLCANAAMSH